MQKRSGTLRCLIHSPGGPPCCSTDTSNPTALLTAAVWANQARAASGMSCALYAPWQVLAPATSAGSLLPPSPQKPLAVQGVHAAADWDLSPTMLQCFASS